MPEYPDTDADGLEDDDMTDSVPRIQPMYADRSYRDLGEKLAALYFARDTNAADDDDSRDETIARIAAQMRRGPRLHAGEFLASGRYRLIDSLSAGGPNGHWKAWDRQVGAFVFLTVFHDGWADDDAEVGRFHAQGQRLVKLEHPNIGRVHEAERSGEGWVYVAQDYYPSGNLRGLATTPDFDAIAALQVIIEAAEGLRHAHDAGVVHGDVRPANLMLSLDGTAHLVDFVVGPRSQGGWGSLYAAPETAERGYVAQPASDVYGLGMTALFALNRGDLPVWVIRDPGRLIESVKAPDHFKRVITKATEWDLTKRYPDVRTLLRELMSDPDLVRILADRGLERGRLAVGAGHFEKLLKTQPHRGVEYRTILGDIYTQMACYDLAHGHLAVAIERSPDVSSLFGPLRVVAARTQQWSRLAELLWTQARQRDAGRRVVLRAELAKINENELNDAKSAREVWGQVLAEHRVPEQAVEALRALMRLCLAGDDGEAFVAYGQELLDYLPEGDEAAAVEYGIGRTLIETLGRVDEGLPWVDRGESHGHSELDLAPVLQQIRAERGQWKRVIKLMIAQARQQDISEASPTLLRAGIIAGSVHLEEDAFEVYHSLLERAPRHVVALRHLARMHHRARQPARALPFYERLWDTYAGRDTEEPEASERAADCTAYASILLREGRSAEAMERLQEALRLTPFHVPSMQLAGPLFLAQGDVDSALRVFESMLRAFKSVERAPQKVDACLGMGDLAWIQGRVTTAMGWYNRALELEPFSVRGWWGLSKVAMSARGGHEGADRAPWVKAVPKRFTTFEALARLLGAMLAPEAMSTWLQRTPLGAAMVEGGASPMRLACAVSEVLGRNELSGVGFFQRLTDAFPDWDEPIAAVRALCAEGRASTFSVHQSYAWSHWLLGDSDYDRDVERTVLPPEPGVPAGIDEGLNAPAAWGDLFSGARTKPPTPLTVIEDHHEPERVTYDGPIGALVRDQAVWLQLDRDQLEVRIGRRAGSDLRIVHDEAVSLDHGRLFRQAGRVYLECAEGQTSVDGESRDLWRLVGGERVTIGETRLHYLAVDDPTQLPPKRREPPRGDDDLVTEPIEAEQPLVALPIATDAAPEPTLDSGTEAAEEIAAEPSLEPDTDPAIDSEVDDEDEVGEELDDDEPSDERLLTEDPPEIIDEPEIVDDVSVEVPVMEPEPAELTEPVSVAALAQLDHEFASDNGAPMAMPSESEEISREEAEKIGASVAASVPDFVEEEDSNAEDAEVIERVASLDDDDPVVPSVAPVSDADDLSVDSLPIVVDNSTYSRASDAQPADAGDELDAPTPPTLRGHPVIVDEPPPVRTPDGEPYVQFDAPVEDSGLQSHDVAGDSGEQTPPPKPGLGEYEDEDVSGSFGFPSEFANDDDIQSDAPVAPKPVVMTTPSMPPDPSATVVAAVPTPPDDPESEAASTAPAAVLEYMSGADRGVQVPIGPSLTVGQSKHCGMSIPGDTRLSPVHCKVESSDEGFKLIDEGSANGTVVNGARIQEIALVGGEVIMVGRTVLRFRVLEEGA